MSESCPLRTRVRTIAFATESTTGTIETLSASDGAINAWDASIAPSVNFNQRQRQGTFSNYKSVRGSKPGEGSFMTDLQSNGSGVALPALATLLAAAGFDSGSGGVYSLVGTCGSTLTYGVYTDGQLERLRGCKVNLEFNMTAGEPVEVSATLSGAYNTNESASLIVPTYPPSNPMVFESATVTIGGTAVRVSSATFNLNNEITLRPDGQKDGGLLAATIVNRRPTLTIDPEEDTLATKNFIAEMLAETTGAISVSCSDGTDDCTFAMPAGQIVEASPEDRDGVFARGLTIEGSYSAANNDEFTITFSTP